MRYVFIWVMLLSLAQIGHAQRILGTWSGQLKLPGIELGVVFHFKDSSGLVTGSMDSPDQSAYGITMDSVLFEDNQLRITAPNGISFKGSLVHNDTLSGLFFQNGSKFPLVLARGAIERKRPQEPHPPFPYRQEEIFFINHRAGDIALAGTLTLPERGDRFPAVVMITGSGPQDRDETIMGHKPFWVIADYLTRRGIAVLRFDDRGVGKSEGDFASATSADFATDVEAAVHFLRSRKDINQQKIGLVGHSEGGLIASMVASKDKNLAFVVSMAGPGLRGDSLLLLQNEAIGRAQGMNGIQLTFAKALNRRIYDAVIHEKDDSLRNKELEKILLPTVPPTLTEAEKKQALANNIREITNPWMLYFLKTDPADFLDKVTCPVLAINGENDLQVPAEENLSAIRLALKKAGNDSITTQIFPKLNHLFQESETGLPAEYGKIQQTISPEVLQMIGDWIEVQTK